MTEKQLARLLARLFYAWLDCYTVLKIGAAVCLLATLQKNGWMDFQEIFQLARLFHTWLGCFTAN